MSIPGHEGCCRTVGDVLTHTVVSALEEKEEELDREIQKLDHLKDEDLEEIRRKRLESLRKNAHEEKKLRFNGHGSYMEIPDEKAFFDCCKKSKHVLCQFFRSSTWRCQIVDKHFEALARDHIETRFIRINIEKCPYLADKLRIVMLPTIMIIKDGKTDHSIIGFDELGGVDDFTTDELEDLLVRWGAIHRLNKQI